MPPASLQLLQRWRVSLEGGLPAPPEVCAWLLSGLEAFERGDCKTLCDGLELRGPGKQSIAYRERLRRRDEALAYALDLIPSDTLTDWQRKRELARECQRFERRRRPLENPSPLDEAIRRVYAAGEKVPTTATGIHEALARLRSKLPPVDRE